MRKRLAVACVVLAFLPARGSAQVELRRHGDRLDLMATAAPLADLLERLARETGMKVVYEGAPPRTLLTVSLLDRTPAEAVLGLFEGLGLNYAVVFDRTGTRIDTLLLAGAAGPGASAARAPASGAASAPAGASAAPTRPQPASRPARGEREERDEPAEELEPTEGQAEAPAEPSPAPSPAPGSIQSVPAPGQPGSPFEFKPRPLTFPTPPPPGAASPAPSPSPTPSPQT